MRSSSYPWIAGVALYAALCSLACAQEIPRPSMARRQTERAPLDYNLKVGQVMLLADVKFNAQYIDNVYLAPRNQESDFVLNPEFGLSAAWQVTQLNVLKLKTSLGYSKYLDHPELDSQNVTLAPDSALSFAFIIGDVRLEIHDQFTLQNETVADGAPGGVARLPRFTNIAGISMLWDMNDIIWTLGYDHYNFATLGDAISTDGQTAGDLSRLDHTTDQVAASLQYQLSSTVNIGLEASAGISDYTNQPSSNYTNLTVGPTLDFQLTPYTSFSVSGGFVAYWFDSGPPVLGVDEDGFLAVIPGPAPERADGYYATLRMRHRMNRYYSDRLEIGHQDQTDALSGRTESNYVRYFSNWNVNQKWSLAIGIYFESVQISDEGGPNGTGQSDYTIWGCNIGTGYRLTQHATISLNYQFTQRDSEDLNQNYVQNRLSFGLGYQF